MPGAKLAMPLLEVHEGAPPAADPVSKPPFAVTWRRWAVLAAFALSNALNAYLWISFAPVANIVAQRFSVTLESVNWLSLVFMILYAPGAVASIYVSERYGIRALLLCAAMLNAVAALARWLGTFAPRPAAFAIVMAGQCVAALAQPAFINAPARIAGDWFRASELATATTIAAMANVVGNALGSSLPSAFVSGPSDVDNTLLGPAAASILVLLVNFFAITSDEPPEPPSDTAARRVLARKALQEASDAAAGGPAMQRSAVREAFDAVRADFAALLANRNFLALLWGFGLGLGVFNALLTLLSQVISPCGYGDDTAGTAGAALLGAGLVGAGLAGAALDRTQAFVPLLQGGIALGLASLIFMVSSLRPNAEAALVGSFGVLGFFLMPLLPLALENAAEATFPVREDNSASLMLGLGNYVGFAVNYALQALLPGAASCSSVLTAPAGLLVALTGAAAVAIVGCYRRDYRRKAANACAAAEETPLAR